MPILRMDFLAGCRYPDTVLEFSNKYPDVAICLLLKSFDRNEATAMNLARMLAHRHRQIILHMAWRDDHNFDDQDLRRVMRMIPSIESMAVTNKESRIYISPLLEHRRTDNKFKQFYKELRHASPHCAHINVSSTNIDGAYREKHVPEGRSDAGIIGSNQVVSNDGADWTVIDHSHYNQCSNRAKMKACWHFIFNCKEAFKSRTPRPERKRLPTFREMEGAFLNLKK